MLQSLMLERHVSLQPFPRIKRFRLSPLLKGRVALAGLCNDFFWSIPLVKGYEEKQQGQACRKLLLQLGQAREKCCKRVRSRKSKDDKEWPTGSGQEYEANEGVGVWAQPQAKRQRSEGGKLLWKGWLHQHHNPVKRVPPPPPPLPVNRVPPPPPPAPSRRSLVKRVISPTSRPALLTRVPYHQWTKVLLL